jgi:glycosyltransferase involved in cell wall biosynthesis
LVIVGKTGWLYDDFFAKLESLQHRDAVLCLGFVPDADLPAVYSGAMLTVLASVYEGFGLPILESMACGTPVVSSHAGSLPEMGAEAARYFDPLDTLEMAAAIGEVWTEGELRQDMVERGFRQAARFSWERAAQQTLQVYDSLRINTSEMESQQC